MAKYVVEQMATVWYRVNVEADTEEQAKELGYELLNKGEGIKTPYSFEWQDEFWVELEEGENN
jgi:hypothetical protein